jgi:uncharacterized pyridoxamine 5'-phosphate oxidase family protein
VGSKMEEFLNLVRNPKDDTISISQNKGRKRGEDTEPMVSHLVNSTQEYNCLIDEILAILRGLDAAFKLINTKVQDILENKKMHFMDSLNNIYDHDETPSLEVSKTLDIYEYYTTKISAISDKLYLCCNKLTLLQQNVKKYVDVVLSLIRQSPTNLTGEARAPQVDQVYKQLSYDFITEILS